MFSSLSQFTSYDTIYMLPGKEDMLKKGSKSMLTLDAIKEYGSDVEEGLTRCMGNEALLLKLISTIPSEERFTKLAECLKTNDLDGAFENAHALKGVTGNLSLKPLYDPLVEITEHLRSRENIDYTELLNEIIKPV